MPEERLSIGLSSDMACIRATRSANRLVAQIRRDVAGDGRRVQVDASRARVSAGTSKSLWP